MRRNDLQLIPMSKLTLSLDEKEHEYLWKDMLFGSSEKCVLGEVDGVDA